MEGDIVVRKVVQEVLLFVLHKQDAITVNLTTVIPLLPVINKEFLRNLRVSVWIESYCNKFKWERFFKNHYNRMTASSYQFANYVAYASYLVNQHATNAYESFYGVLSVIVHFALHCWQGEYEKYLNSCVHLFCKFYESEISTKFEEQGGWENFNDFLLKTNDKLDLWLKFYSNDGIFNLFQQLEEEHLQHQQPYAIGGVVLKDITESHVIDDEKSVTFADSVISEVQCLFEKTLKEVIDKDFAETDRQLELYGKSVAEVTDGTKMLSLQKDQDSDMKNEVERSSKRTDQEVPREKTNKKMQQKSQVKSDKNTPSPKQKGKASQGKKGKMSQSPLQEVPQKEKENNPGANKNQKQTEPMQHQDADSSNSQAFGPAIQEWDENPKFSKTEEAKLYLKEMLEDVDKIYELIKFVCREDAK